MSCLDFYKKKKIIIKRKKIIHWICHLKDLKYPFFNISQSYHGRDKFNSGEKC